VGIDLTGWTLSEADAISADGRSMAGFGAHNGLDEAWVATLPQGCSGPGNGDGNGDGATNGSDIAGMVNILVTGASGTGYCASDSFGPSGLSFLARTRAGMPIPTAISTCSW